MFITEDGYKLKLKMPETMKLSGSTKKLMGKTRNGENVPSVEVVEVNHIEPSNLVFLKTYKTEFDNTY